MSSPPWSLLLRLCHLVLSRGDIIADMHEDDSPYDEVRVSVSNLDDPDMPSTSLVSPSGSSDRDLRPD